MPAVRPRITFTPQAETLRPLQRIARVTKQPIAALVTECMVMMNEHLVNLAVMLEEASNLTADTRAIMFAAAGRASDDLRPQVMEAQRVLSELSRTIEDLTANPEPPLPLGPARPPSSNTGATSVAEGVAK